MGLDKKQKLELYTNMVRVRALDEFLVDAYFTKKLAGPFYHSQQGQEAIGVGVCTFLNEDDYVWYTHRGHGICEVLSKGVPARQIVAEHYGKETGSCRGIGFINTCSPDKGIFGMGGTVGGEATLAGGVALAAKLANKNQVVACFIGDGAIGEGSVHTAMLMSANWKLPLIWICSNNGMSMWVPVDVAYPKENIADWAFGYNIPSEIVDGQDVCAVHNAAKTAIDRARKGEGPSFIELKTCRYNAQVEGAPDLCMDGMRSEEEVAHWKQRDPVKLFQEALKKEGILDQAGIERIYNEAAAEIQAAEKFANESPVAEPGILEDALYAE